MNTVIDNFKVFIVDDDPAVRDFLWAMLRARGIDVEVYVSGDEFVKSCQPGRFGVLLLDLNMPGLSGLDVMDAVRNCCIELPCIAMTGNSTVPLAVRAMKAGAFDFIEKPFDEVQIMTLIEQAREKVESEFEDFSKRQQAKGLVARLSNREREILSFLIAGQTTKRIAADLGLSERTVEVHRSNIITKLEIENVAGAVRVALEAGVRAPSHA